MLIRPAFEKPIDTVHDILPTMDVMVPGATSIVTLIHIDPRPSIKIMQKQMKLYLNPPGGNIPQYIREG